MSSQRLVVEHADGQDLTLGIATDVRSWKLCFELNKILDIKLRNTGDSAISDPSPDSPPPQQVQLFDATPVVQERFEDLESKPGTEYILLSKESQKLPPEARPFRFFLLIRSESRTLSSFDQIASRLNASPFIASVVNFSDNKNLQSLLP